MKLICYNIVKCTVTRDVINSNNIFIRNRPRHGSEIFTRLGNVHFINVSPPKDKSAPFICGVAVNKRMSRLRLKTFILNPVNASNTRPSSDIRTEIIPNTGSVCVAFTVYDVLVLNKMEFTVCVTSA